MDLLRLDRSIASYYSGRISFFSIFVLCSNLFVVVHLAKFVLLHRMGTLTWLKRQSVCHLLIAINFFVSGLAVNVLQAILFVTVRPISKRWYRIVNQYLCYSVNCQLVFLVEWWSNSETIFYIDKIDLEKYYNKEHGYLIMNHTYEVDWLMGFLLCERIGVLGNCKAYAKKAIQYVPAIGWLWKFAEFVFLERNLGKDKEIIGKQITELVDHPTPIMLLLFAEGTRFTKEKHTASVKFAQDRNLPILKHHLSPRTKGFTMSLPFMRGKGGLYDIILCVKDSHPVAPTITNILKAEHLEAHLFAQRISLDEVPVDEEGAAAWLHNLYVRKDKMVDSFKKTGDFFATSGVDRLEPFTLPRRWYSLANTIGWGSVTLPTVGYVLYSLLFSGSLYYFCLGVLMVVAIFYLLYTLTGLMKISKSSSYGKSEGNNHRSSKLAYKTD